MKASNFGNTTIVKENLDIAGVISVTLTNSNDESGPLI